MDDLNLDADGILTALDARRQALGRGDEAGAIVASEEVMRRVEGAGVALLPPMMERQDGPPPQHIARILIRSLFSAPHLAHTLGYPGTLGDPVPFRLSPALADAVGLELSALEEEREAADRDTTHALRRTQALRWLWGRSADPTTQPVGLSSLLFPGRPPASGFLRRGGRLYGLFDTREAMPPESLFLPWLPARTDDALWPDAAFALSEIEPAARRQLGTALGLDADVVGQLLDGMICAVPSVDTNPYIHRDRWRNEGWADLTGLGRCEDVPFWATWPLAADAFEEDAIFTRSGLHLEAARKAFHRHALGRAEALLKAHLADLSARVLTGEGKSATRRALLYDIGHALQRVLRPLLLWPTQPETAAWVAQRHQLSEAATAQVLHDLSAIWRESSQAWCDTSRPHSVAIVLLRHLVVSRAALLRTMSHPGHPRYGHARVALVFFATASAALPASRLWRAQLGAPPGPEDLLAQWFYPLWRQLIEVQLSDE